MRFRFFGAFALVMLAGCGGADAPPRVVETESAPVSEPAVATTDTSSSKQLANSQVPPDTAPADPNKPAFQLPGDAATIESLATSMEQAVQNQNFEEALGFAEKALKLDPEDPSLLFIATQLAQRQGMDLEEADVDRKVVNQFFLRSADYLRQIQKTGEEFSEAHQPYLSQVFYNEARAHANMGNDAQALAALEEAFAAGFDSFRTLDSEADFAKLRGTPAFIDAVKPRREEYERQSLDSAKAQLAAHESYPFDFDLVSTTGKSVSLADYQGKILIVDFWGTWCPPCRMEIPHFVELLKNYREAGLEMVGINYEHAEPDEAIALINTFAKQNGITYPCLLGDEATQAQVPRFEGFPTTLFIDRSGKVRLQLVGYHPYEHLESIVKTLLAESGEPTDGAATTP